MRSPSSKHRLLHFLLPLLFLFAILAIFITDCILLDRASLAFVRSSSPRDTLVGLPEPRFFTDPDAYAWLNHTRDMLLAGDWRIRHTHMDNAPYGRPMHWSHLLIWELAAHARILQHLHPDMLLSPALEIAGRCSMPFFFLLFIPSLYFVFYRKLGFLPAAVFALSSAVFPFFAEIFTPLQPDHHVFQYLFPLVTVTALTFGGWGRVASDASPTPSCPSPNSFWMRPLELPSLPSACRWFLLAGAAHACLLWIGASVWLVVHCVLCLAALAALAPPTPDSRPVPRLWLSFLATSLPLSVTFYLLEYAPRFPGMRLEVNNPLYCLFLLGSVLVLSRISTLRDFRSPRTLQDLILPLLLAIPLPLALLFGPDAWHALHDPFLKRLHACHINEFRPYTDLLRKHPFHPFTEFRLFLVPLLATPFLAFSSWFGQGSPTHRVLRPHAVLITAFVLLTFFQQRWGTLLSSVLMLPSLLLVCIARRTSRPVSSRLVIVLLVLLAIDAACVSAARFRAIHLVSANRQSPDHWVTCDLYKRAALRLAATASSAPDGASWALAGFAPDAPVFYYFGGIPSLASYYWENAAGWHAEAPFLASSPDAIPAERLADVRNRGLARVLVNHGADFPELYLYVASGIRDSRRAYLQTLLGNLHLYPKTALPAPFISDPVLTESLSRTNLYALPHISDHTFAPESLPWAAYSLVP